MELERLINEIAADMLRNNEMLLDAWVSYKGIKWHPYLARDRDTRKKGIEVNISGKWGSKREVGREKYELREFLLGIANGIFPVISTVRCKPVDSKKSNSKNARHLSELQMSERLTMAVSMLRSIDSNPPTRTFDAPVSTLKLDSDSSALDVVDSVSSDEDEYRQFVTDTRSLSPTERDALVKVRYGQGAFRSALIDIAGDTCWISGVQGKALLIASHIQPWSHCEKNPEGRCSPDNGLLLSSLWDAAFDSGLITFDEAWQVVLSPILSRSAIRALGLEKPCALPERYRNARRAQYLAYHRVVVFKATSDA